MFYRRLADRGLQRLEDLRMRLWSRLLRPAGRPELREASGLARGGSQEGSAMVIAVLIVVILTLLGLAFMLAGDTESKIARNQRDAAQAGFIAEGGVRAVKKWFD